MSTKDLHDAFQMIATAQDEDSSVGGETRDDLIEQAENTLDTKFPPSYREFLRRFGHGGIGSMEIMGVYDGVDPSDTSPINLVGINLEERKSGTPEDILLIEEGGNGDFYAIDLSSKGLSGEPQVVVWPIGGTEDRDSLETVADDFGEFLKQRVTTALRVIREFKKPRA